MNIYHLSQDDNLGHDTYDSCIVYAETIYAARLIMPSSYSKFGRDNWADSPESVSVRYIGTTTSVVAPGVILASFNAG